MTPVENIIAAVATIFTAGICVGAAVERFMWWKRGHRDNNPEDR